MPSPVQGSVFTNRLKQLFGFRGRYTISLDENVLPVIELGQLGPAALPPIRRVWSAQFNEAAVVGESAKVVLSTPPGVICRITHVLCIPGATDQRINAGMQGAGAISTAGFTSQNAAYFEDRLVANNEDVPATNIVSGTAAGAVVTATWTDVFQTAPVISAWRPVNWFLGTGDGATFGFLALEATVANEAIRFGFRGEEYQEL